jgi:SH3-like domain-containing protein
MTPPEAAMVKPFRPDRPLARPLTRPLARLPAFLSVCLFAGLLALAPARLVLAQSAGTAEAEAELGASGLPLPRFVTLRAAEVNLRGGPGARYPIEWVFTRKGLPVEVVDEFETWRRIRDWQGSEGWVHQSMLSGQRGAMVVGADRLLRRAPEPGAPAIAEVQVRVVGRLHRCRDGWCLIEAKGYEGWLRQDEIYGAYPGETSN